MSIIQISKIQVRTGNLVDLPQLSAGELGWADDERRLFIGNDSNRVGDPDPNNTEILTKYSPIELSGNVTIANVENLHVGGGENGYFLQTDGNGTLVWSALPSTSNGTVAGSTYQIQYNNAGSLNASANLRYYDANVTLDVSGNIKSANLTVNVFAEFANGLFSGNVQFSNTAQNTFVVGSLGNTGNFVTIGSGQLFGNRITVNQANVNANIIANTITANLLIRAATTLAVNDGSNSNTAGNLIVGNNNVWANSDGISLTGNIIAQGNIEGNNITGNIILINDSITIGNVVIANGNIEADNIIANAGVFQGNGSSLTNLNASNLSTGTVPSGRLSGAYSISVTSATTAGTVTTAAQPNITSVGTLTSLTVGNVTSSDTIQADSLIIDNGAIITGNITNTGSTDISANLSVGGNISASSAIFGNTVTAATFVGNVNTPTILNGNSNITIFGNGDIRMSSNGQADVISIVSNGTTANTSIANSVTVVANLTAGNLIGPLANGNSNIRVVANANIVMTVSGNNIANFTGTNANIFGNLTVSSNITAQNILAPLANGNSNVSIPAINGNVNISAIGAANVVVVTDTGAIVNGQFTVNGNIDANNVDAGNLLVANYVTGTLTTAAQPNITSLGTITDLDISNSITVSANIDANVIIAANGLYGELQSPSQVLITEVGQLEYLAVGNTSTTDLYANGDMITGGNVTVSDRLYVIGLLDGTFSNASSSQPNITSVGNLVNLTVNGNLDGNVAEFVDLVVSNSLVLSNTVYWGNSSGALTVTEYLDANNAYVGNLYATASMAQATISNAAVQPLGNIDVSVSTLRMWEVATTANFELDIINVNNVMASNNSLTVTAIVKNPLSVGYVPSNVKIDGTNANVNWIDGAPTPVTGGYDIYNFNILKKAANTYFVLGKRDSTS